MRLDPDHSERSQPGFLDNGPQSRTDRGNSAFRKRLGQPGYCLVNQRAWWQRPGRREVYFYRHDEAARAQHRALPAQHLGRVGNIQDDSAVGRFWAEALGWSVSSEEPGVTNVEPVGFAYPDPVAVCIDVLAVPEPKTVKNRVHIDLGTTSAAHRADLVARLQDLGATPADVGQGDVSWTVLADPEGNEFCVLAPWPGGRDTGPVAAVTVDCADPRAMARFWDEAMDWTLHQVTDDHAVLRSATGVGPYLQFLRTSDRKTVKNRVHLDLRPYPGDDQAAEVARLRALGATDIDLGQGDVSWTVLADPEGNEFDVLTPR